MLHIRQIHENRINREGGGGGVKLNNLCSPQQHLIRINYRRQCYKKLEQKDICILSKLPNLVRVTCQINTYIFYAKNGKKF